MKFIKIAAILGLLAVVAGAFGAHALKNILDPDKLSAWQTAVAYQFYHVLALVLVGFLQMHPVSAKNTLLPRSGWAFVAGILMFSGSIYLLALRDLLPLGAFTKVLGPITPIGGVFFIIGWLLLFLSLPRTYQKQSE